MTRVVKIAMLVGIAAFAVGASATAFAQAGKDQATPSGWSYEIKDGKRVPKGNRVNSADGGWREGELLIFDDSMEHEARNDSDKARYILLFECWKPEIAAADRDALSRLLQASRPVRED